MISMIFGWISRTMNGRIQQKKAGEMLKNGYTQKKNWCLKAQNT